MKLSQAAAEALAPRTSAYIEWDERLTGFGCRVTPGGVRSWVFAYRPGGGRRSPWKTITLGRITDLPYHKARAAAEKLLHQTKLGADPVAARNEARTALTVEELADKFLAEVVDPKRKPSTAKLYRKQFGTYIKPALGKKRARDVTFSDCAKLHRTLGERAPVVANRVKALIGTFYSWAGKAGHVPRGMNPVRDIDGFRERARDRYLTTDELARLGDALHEAETIGLGWVVDETKPKAKHLPKRENRREIFPVHVTAAFRLLILTGCRRGEVLNARWGDVDWERA